MKSWMKPHEFAGHLSREMDRAMIPRNYMTYGEWSEYRYTSSGVPEHGAREIFRMAVADPGWSALGIDPQQTTGSMDDELMGRLVSLLNRHALTWIDENDPGFPRRYLFEIR